MAFNLEPITLVAISTGGLALLLSIAFGITYCITRKRGRRHGRHVSLHTVTPASGSLSRADSTMSKQTELFGSPMPSMTPTPTHGHAHGGAHTPYTPYTPNTGTTLVGTPHMYVGGGARGKEGYGLNKGGPDRGHGAGLAGMGAGGVGAGVGRSPYTRQNSDQRAAGGDSPHAKKGRERYYSAATTVDGRGSVVVITYEQGLAEMGRQGLVSPARTAVAKVEAAYTQSQSHAQLTSPRTMHTGLSRTHEPPEPGTAPESPTFSSFTDHTPPSTLHTTSPPPPLRPSRPSVSRRNGSSSNPAGDRTPMSGTTPLLASARTPVTAMASAMPTAQSQDSTRRDAPGRGGLEYGHGKSKVPDEPKEEEWDREGMSPESPKSGYLLSYYQPAGERRRTRTRGGKI